MPRENDNSLGKFKEFSSGQINEDDIPDWRIGQLPSRDSVTHHQTDSYQFLDADKKVFMSTLFN